MSVVKLPTVSPEAFDWRRRVASQIKPAVWIWNISKGSIRSENGKTKFETEYIGSASWNLLGKVQRVLGRALLTVKAKNKDNKLTLTATWNRSPSLTERQELTEREEEGWK